MSRLVVMEGWIKQKVKDEFTEVYVVLTEMQLKVYKTQIMYKTRPNETIKCLDLSDAYNILPITFNKDFQFSIFKKGEKAQDRLFLQAASQIDYDSWVNNIESIITSKSKRTESNKVTDDKKTNDSKGSPSPTVKITEEKRTNDSKVTPSPTVKSPPYRSSFKISNSSSNEPPELKDLQDKYSKLKDELEKTKAENANLIKENKDLKTHLTICQDDLKKSIENNSKNEKETENLAKKNSENERQIAKINEEIRKLKLEKQNLKDKNLSLEKEIENCKVSSSKNNELEEKQITRIVTDLSKSIKSAGMDLSSYMYCVDRLHESNKSSMIMERLLPQQLINLIHYCSIDLNTTKTILDYLTVHIDLSQDFVIVFVSRLLTVLSNYISLSSVSKCDPDPDLISAVRSVVIMTKPSKKMDKALSFHQTLLEIAYLLSKKINLKAKISNGISEDLFKTIDSQYETCMKMYKLDTKKIMLLELGEQMKENFKSRTENKENLETKDVSPQSSMIIKSFVEKKWDDTLQKLQQKEKEIQDLLITIEQMSNRINILETENGHSQFKFSFDEIINIYAMNAEILCPTCQTHALTLLEMPVNEKVNIIVSDFKSYWKTLLNVHALLSSKQQYNNGFREIFEKITQSTKDFELLMKQFSEITQRNIENPLLQRPSLLSNDQ